MSKLKKIIMFCSVLFSIVYSEIYTVSSEAENSTNFNTIAGAVYAAMIAEGGNWSTPKFIEICADSAGGETTYNVSSSIFLTNINSTAANYLMIRSRLGDRVTLSANGASIFRAKMRHLIFEGLIMDGGTKTHHLMMNESDFTRRHDRYFYNCTIRNFDRVYSIGALLSM